MAAAVERYTMPSEFLNSMDNSLIPAVLPADDRNDSPTPTPTNDVDLPRAASYTYFPTIQDSFIDLPTISPIKGTFSVENLLPESLPVDDTSLSSGASTPESDSPPLEIRTETKVDKPKSTVLRNGLPKLATTNATSEKSKEVRTPKDSVLPAQSDELSDLPPSPVSSSLSSRFRRRSWLPSSRSPSPRKSAGPDSPVDGTQPPSKGVRAGRRNSLRQSMVSDNTPETKEKRSRSTSLSRRLSNRLRGRTLSTITDGVTSEETTPVPPIDMAKVAHLPKSFSTDKLPLSTLNRPIPVADRIPTVPRAASEERRRTSRTESARKRDELWTVFRNLDGDYQK
jgi:hypothetical protein